MAWVDQAMSKVNSSFHGLRPSSVSQDGEKRTTLRTSGATTLADPKADTTCSVEDSLQAGTPNRYPCTFTDEPGGTNGGQQIDGGGGGL